MIDVLLPEAPAPSFSSSSSSSLLFCAAPGQPDPVPDYGPPQHQRLETAVPQAPVTVQAGGGGVTCSGLHREAS